MSYMTMTMFAQRIWGFDLSSPEARIARQAGWSRSDLLWEGLMEQALAAWHDGDQAVAAVNLRRASWIARLFFARDDLHRATVLVNQGIVARASGQTRRIQLSFAIALTHWSSHAAPTVTDMQIAPRARSSLFHLRMEAGHRATYQNNMRLRLSKIATEVQAAIEAICDGNAVGCRLFSRWEGEKPNVFDDTRKTLGLVCSSLMSRPNNANKTRQDCASLPFGVLA